ncbi:MAG: 4-vinyl reductase [Actinobacteria bacterium]|nr:4-vinyl reductase [Actinomycetota bacterium]MBU1944191.1 4-vinyl reductase [Actinomycetota bacterium]MBU2687510.1 4-vinyl reductase [Actinomycetota bacterium]
MMRRVELRILLFAMEFLERHPLVVRLLRPLSRLPFVSRRLMVLPRAFMGSTAFEIHDVDLERGRIGIGGVEEIMFGAKVVEQMHAVMESRMGPDDAREALYELGYNLCRWEVTTALGSGRWAPRALVPLISSSAIIDDVRTDPLLARFFVKTMNMVSRLITDEGGWGRLDFEEVAASPMRVKLYNSQEAAWLGPSDRPVCHLYTGIVAGYTSAISGEDLRAREVECAAMGAPCCMFEIDR